MELYKLAKSCNYGEMKDEMIRDRLVVGIRDNALSQRLQLDADLTLEKAKKMVRQREAVGEQQQLLKGTVASSLDELQPRRDRRKQGKKFHAKGRANSSTTAATQPQSKSCTRCGKGQHPRDKCPAKDATCHRCSKKGHYGSQCFTKNVSQVESANDMDAAFLDTVSAYQSPAWLTTIQVNGENISFKMDTGAEVTAISENTHQHLKEPRLTTASKILYNPI